MAARWAMTTARTAFRMPMVDPLQERLRLTQVLGAAFPVGSFAHSQGLEWAMATGPVGNAQALQDWIAASLAQGALRFDAVLLALALRPGADLDHLAALYDAYLPASGRAVEAAELGMGFAALTDPGAPAYPYVLAVARELRGLSLPHQDMVALFLQTAVASPLSAAVRFLPLGQGAAQRLLAALAPDIAALTRLALASDETALATFAPLADIAAMAQDSLQTRIFRS